MKKRAGILTIISFCCLISSGFSQNQSITFNQGSWEEILSKAEKENKMIFLDAYASWCRPCKWRETNVFTKDSVADFYNDKFINVKIDMEKGEGIELKKKHGVKAYLTLFYINSKGEVEHRACGALQVN